MGYAIISKLRVACQGLGPEPRGEGEFLVVESKLREDQTFGVVGGFVLLVGYVPWQFSMPDAGKGYEVAWKKLLDSDGFAAPFGPTTVERRDPMFVLKKTCCWWSGQSWPYATSQTLKALANLLQEYEQTVVAPADYVKLLQVFAKTHRKNGKPYLAEACHPDSRSFDGHDSYNHSEHYFHSSFNDLVITGLIGLHPRDDDVLQVKPLAPAEWAYFAIDSVPYRGRLISVVWDRDGSRYKRGKGFKLFADGKEIAASSMLGPLSATLPPVSQGGKSPTCLMNFAANNDGAYFPRVTTSFSNPTTSPAKLIDGNYWYHRDPPNRFTFEGSPNASDHIVIDFGMNRSIHTIKLYCLDDGTGILPPERIELERWDGQAWQAIPGQSRSPEKPTGRRENVIQFPTTAMEKVRAVLHHAVGGKSGLTEFEAWGDGERPVSAAPHPAGNLAYNPGDKPFLKASASYSDRFGGKPALAIDGIVNFLPSPTNRWTSYESPNTTDWLEVDFGAEKAFRRVELAIYDDRGGVQPPVSYEVEYWNGNAWRAVTNAMESPDRPTGSQFNEVSFDRVKGSKVRIVFTHAGKARSGVSEILVWND